MEDLELLYDLLNKENPEVFGKVEKDQFVRDFSNGNNLSELYTAIERHAPRFAEKRSREEFVRDFNTQESRGVDPEKNFLDLGRLNNTLVGDWMDDIARSVARGSRSGQSIGETLTLMSKDSGITSENIEDFIEASERSQSLEQSEEMRQFMADGGFETGKGWGSFLENWTTIVPEMIVESMSSLVSNKETLATAGGTVLTGTATGAGVGALFGGVGAGYCS